MLLEKRSESRSVVSNCLQPHELYSPWNSPGQNTGVGSCSLLQRILSSQELSPGLCHSSTLAWKIPWTEEPGGLQSMGPLESDTTEWLHFHFSLSCIGEGNGKPLQCSCLENCRDGGAQWAAVYGVAQSRTRLKWLSSSSSSHIAGVFFTSWATREACW